MSFVCFELSTSRMLIVESCQINYCVDCTSRANRLNVNMSQFAMSYECTAFFTQFKAILIPEFASVTAFLTSLKLLDGFLLNCGSIYQRSSLHFWFVLTNYGARGGAVG